ncbi:MAG TPA: translesion DNA synthesis-associated protein ImuA [Steroidobacteraceae bacterium]|jgi:protein ImuA|nr:translesion DNA synthesis-associated protein ImuA [Steroidobacteraceae bacterium]
MTAQLLHCAPHPGRDELRLQLERMCRSGQTGEEAGPIALPTGFAQLDAVLPGGGWPVGAITELMPDAQGIGELSLLLPALAQLSCAGRCIVWIAPPCLPYPPALARHGLALEHLLLVQARDAQTRLWATEQALRCPAVGAVLAWPAALDERRIRRLQLAAEAGGSCGLLYRPPAAAQQPSPAALRLRLQALDAGLRIEIQKARGGRAHALVVHPAAAICA